MSRTIKIQSRASFQEGLERAVADTQALMERLPEWGILPEIEGQLAFMKKATAHGLDPTPEEQAMTNLGLVSLRHFEGIEPEYARLLSELNYVFRRHQRLSRWSIMDSGRHGVLQVWSGPAAFRKIVLDPGQALRVGSTGEADITLDGDEHLAPVHFEVLWDGVVGQIFDRSGRGPMLIAGGQDWGGELGNRDEMTAGSTEFRLLVERWTPPEPDAVQPASDEEIAAAMEKMTPLAKRGELFAVIDAARSTRALTLLEESTDPYRSLYDGEKGRKLEAIAPHLVHLGADLRLLEVLVREGLGDSWGIFLVSSTEMLRLRRHLRKFLKVELEGQERPVFFRFYDPRALRDFLPIATKEQLGELFGEHIELLVVESEKGADTVQLEEHGCPSLV